MSSETGTRPLIAGKPRHGGGEAASLRAELGRGLWLAVLAPTVAFAAAVMLGMPVALALGAGVLMAVLARLWLGGRLLAGHAEPVDALLRRLREIAQEQGIERGGSKVEWRGGSGATVARRQVEALVELGAARAAQAEHKLAEAREAAHYAGLLQAAALEIGGEMAAFSLPQLTRLAVERMREAMGADFAVMCLQDPASGHGGVSASSGLAESAEAGGLRPCCVEGQQPGRPCPVSCPAGRVQFAAPLSWGKVELGALCVGFDRPHVLSPAERRFIDEFAHMVAIGVSNARLHWNLESLAMHEERERIAGELHDGIIQSLYGTGLGLLDCIRLVEENPPAARARLGQTIDDLNGVIRDVRGYVIGLESEALRRSRFSDAVRDFLVRMSLNGGVEVDTDIDPDCDLLLTPEQSAQLFQVCRELFLNTIKHAAAARVSVSLTQGEDGMCLEVIDNGRGFDPANRRSGHGLRSMEMRVRRLGGSLELDARPGAGTRVVVRVPFEAPPLAVTQ